MKKRIFGIFQNDKDYLFWGDRVNPDEAEWRRSELERNPKLMKEIWAEHRGELMREWLEKYSGQRPWAWWILDAPKDQRQWISGRGELVPMIEPEFVFGVPVNWYEIDEENPPMFESEPAYLRRHNIFEPGEQEKLYEVHYEPECILDIHGFKDEQGRILKCR